MPEYQDLPCPEPGCDQRFLTEYGLVRHLDRAHAARGRYQRATPEEVA